MVKVRTFVCIGMLLTGGRAADITDSLKGVWSGTVGKAKVNVCFQQYGYANYYYLKYRQPIRLQHGDDSNDWYEPDSCQWTIEKVNPGSASGTWRNPKTGVTLPVTLRLTGAEDDDNSCGCDLYNAPIEKLPPITVDTVRAMGLCYSTFSLEEGDNGMGWFQLCGNSDAVQMINKELSNGFPADSSDGARFYDCRRSTLSAFGSDEYELNRSVFPYLRAGRFLEVQKTESGFCGGPHPYSGVEYTMYDLSTGETVDLHSWVREGENLRKLILQQYVPDGDGEDQCADMVRENDIYSLRLDSTGIVFYTEFGHCCVSCDQEFLLTFDALKPFLTEEGRESVKLMLKKGKRPGKKSE